MKANRLIHESSPYLLQHAHNPVDWYPWGEEAFLKARTENKPLLVSIGYAACHWCHVMERESFENQHTADVMNAHFVNIKIDREERPDLDHIYMDAVQAITGSGGWPLHVFLTPEGKPFYGGTYFPPVRRYNRPSWEETLLSISALFREKRDSVEQQAESLTGYLMESNAFGTTGDSGGRDLYDKSNELTVLEHCMKLADTVAGGFGTAPKFPQTFIIQFLLRYYHFTKDQTALDQACLSLDSMIHGGIYDQIGGGFSRYATDTEWLIPHFEKMLYDNALLTTVLSEAYQLTGKKIYRRAIEETIAFVQRELMSPENGFYSALDADSEGEEGKYYVWQKQEIEELAGPDSSLFCEYYGISELGNWEGNNILHIHSPLEELARRHGKDAGELEARINEIKTALLHKREQRVRPALDDKILLNWNALFNIACCKAYAALGNEAYRKLAVDNMNFLWERLRNGEAGGFFHSYKNRTAKHPGFLDDYASLIQALIHLQEITGEAAYLDRALRLTEYVSEHFSDSGGIFFYFTHKEQGDIIVRKKEIYDGATPSANALMAENLCYLGLVYGRPDWQERSLSMLRAIHHLVLEYPASFGMWANFLQKVSRGINELVIMGKEPGRLHREVLALYIPNRVLQTATTENPRFPLLAGKQPDVKTQVYLCRNYTCQPPVETVDLLLSSLGD